MHRWICFTFRGCCRGATSEPPTLGVTIRMQVFNPSTCNLCMNFLQILYLNSTIMTFLEICCHFQPHFGPHHKLPQVVVGVPVLSAQFDHLQVPVLAIRENQSANVSENKGSGLVDSVLKKYYFSQASRQMLFLFN